LLCKVLGGMPIFKALNINVPILNLIHTHTHTANRVRQDSSLVTQTHINRDVMELANIRIRQMRISCAKSVRCGCGFVTQSKLLAIAGFVTTVIQVIQLSYLILSSCKQTSSKQLK